MEFIGFTKVRVEERWWWWGGGAKKSAGPAQWAFILLVQAVQAIKLSAKRGHY